MRRLVFYGWLLTTVIAGCGPSSEPGGRETSKPEPVLQFEQALLEELVPELDELSHDEIQNRINALALKILVPHKGTLHDLASSRMAELAAFDGRLDTYRDVFDSEQQKALEEFRKSLGAKVGEEEAAVLLAGGCWDPSKAALMWRTMVTAQMVGPERISKRSTILALVPARVEVLERDAEKPTMAVVFGPEVFFVRLEYDEASGVYMPTEFQWLIRERQEAR
jgi:hypothetical protein